MVKNYDNYFDEEEKKVRQQIKTIIFSVIGIFILLIILVIIFGSFYTISAGERGVILTFGKPSMISQGEGLHFKLPIIQKAIIFDVKTQKYEAELTSASKDLQDVKQKIAINYHILPEQVPEIYTTIGKDYAEKIIFPYEQETNKGITSQYTAEELITRREEVRQKMKDALKEKLQSRGIIVEEISIINFEFSPAFTQAIENKVMMEQNALAQKNKLEQIKYEAQQRITQATAEAEAIQIQAQAIQSQGGQAYLTLKWIEKWNGQQPQVMLSDGVNTFVDISKFTA